MPADDSELGNPTGALPVPPVPKSALVTGGAQRIGRALVLALAEDGFAVAVHYHGSREAAENLVEAICNRGGRAVALGADLADEDAVGMLLPRAEQALGPIGTAPVTSADRVTIPGLGPATDRSSTGHSPSEKALR